ncbi:Mycothiol acetyltransferase [Cytospora mali]|uniref:Mycothiol acetyltransferase n=1 Tax=Cytospora mali TaxID=578113 RepID=A0A194VYM4_CYTMA|nr:Mycothiol acetyltransferase [Valsa mali]
MASLEMLVPSEADVGRIAEIHLAAMNSNILLHAQFPTSQALQNLEPFLASLTISQLKDPKVGVLVARHPQLHDIISFIKWDLPVLEGHFEEGIQDFKWSDGCCQKYLDEYAFLAEQAKQRAIGDLLCYRVTFVCTDPRWQGHGAGSVLTRKVMGEARAIGMPVYLESTLEAVKMYETLGFEQLDEFEMVIPKRDGSGTQRYKEVCMLWRPGMQ